MRGAKMLIVVSVVLVVSEADSQRPPQPPHHTLRPPQPPPHPPQTSQDPRRHPQRLHQYSKTQPHLPHRQPHPTQPLQTQPQLPHTPSPSPVQPPPHQSPPVPPQVHLRQPVPSHLPQPPPPQPHPPQPQYSKRHNLHYNQQPSSQLYHTQTQRHSTQQHQHSTPPLAQQFGSPTQQGHTASYRSVAQQQGGNSNTQQEQQNSAQTGFAAQTLSQHHLQHQLRYPQHVSPSQHTSSSQHVPNWPAQHTAQPSQRLIQQRQQQTQTPTRLSSTPPQQQTKRVSQHSPSPPTQHTQQQNQQSPYVQHQTHSKPYHTQQYTHYKHQPQQSQHYKQHLAQHTEQQQSPQKIQQQAQQSQQYKQRQKQHPPHYHPIQTSPLQAPQTSPHRPHEPHSPVQYPWQRGPQYPSWPHQYSNPAPIPSWHQYPTSRDPSWRQGNRGHQRQDSRPAYTTPTNPYTPTTPPASQPDVVHPASASTLSQTPVSPATSAPPFTASPATSTPTTARTPVSGDFPLTATSSAPGSAFTPITDPAKVAALNTGRVTQPHSNLPLSTVTTTTPDTTASVPDVHASTSDPPLPSTSVLPPTSTPFSDPGFVLAAKDTPTPPEPITNTLISPVSVTVSSLLHTSLPPPSTPETFNTLPYATAHTFTPARTSATANHKLPGKSWNHDQEIPTPSSKTNASGPKIETLQESIAEFTVSPGAVDSLPDSTETREEPTSHKPPPQTPRHDLGSSTESPFSFRPLTMKPVHLIIKTPTLTTEPPLQDTGNRRANEGVDSSSGNLSLWKDSAGKLPNLHTATNTPLLEAMDPSDSSVEGQTTAASVHTLAVSGIDTRNDDGMAFNQEVISDVTTQSNSSHFNATYQPAVYTTKNNDHLLPVSSSSFSDDVPKAVNTDYTIMKENTTRDNVTSMQVTETPLEEVPSQNENVENRHDEESNNTSSEILVALVPLNSNVNSATITISSTEDVGEPSVTLSGSQGQKLVFTDQQPQEAPHTSAPSPVPKPKPLVPWPTSRPRPKFPSRSKPSSRPTIFFGKNTPSRPTSPHRSTHPSQSSISSVQGSPSISTSSTQPSQPSRVPSFRPSTPSRQKSPYNTVSPSRSTYTRRPSRIRPQRPSRLQYERNKTSFRLIPLLHRFRNQGQAQVLPQFNPASGAEFKLSKPEATKITADEIVKGVLPQFRPSNGRISPLIRPKGGSNTRYVNGTEMDVMTLADDKKTSENITMTGNEEPEKSKSEFTEATTDSLNTEEMVTGTQNPQLPDERKQNTYVGSKHLSPPQNDSLSPQTHEEKADAVPEAPHPPITTTSHREYATGTVFSPGSVRIPQERPKSTIIPPERAILPFIKSETSATSPHSFSEGTESTNAAAETVEDKDEKASDTPADSHSDLQPGVTLDAEKGEATHLYYTIENSPVHSKPVYTNEKGDTSKNENEFSAPGSVNNIHDAEEGLSPVINVLPFFQSVIPSRHLVMAGRQKESHGTESPDVPLLQSSTTYFTSSEYDHQRRDYTSNHPTQHGFQKNGGFNLGREEASGTHLSSFTTQDVYKEDTAANPNTDSQHHPQPILPSQREDDSWLTYMTTQGTSAWPSPVHTSANLGVWRPVYKLSEKPQPSASSQTLLFKSVPHEVSKETISDREASHDVDLYKQHETPIPKHQTPFLPSSHPHLQPTTETLQPFPLHEKEVSSSPSSDHEDHTFPTPDTTLSSQEPHTNSNKIQSKAPESSPGGHDRTVSHKQTSHPPPKVPETDSEFMFSESNNRPLHHILSTTVPSTTLLDSDSFGTDSDNGQNILQGSPTPSDTADRYPSFGTDSPLPHTQAQTLSIPTRVTDPKAIEDTVSSGAELHNSFQPKLHVVSKTSLPFTTAIPTSHQTSLFGFRIPAQSASLSATRVTNHKDETLPTPAYRDPHPPSSDVYKIPDGSKPSDHIAQLNDTIPTTSQTPTSSITTEVPYVNSTDDTDSEHTPSKISSVISSEAPDIKIDKMQTPPVTTSSDINSPSYVNSRHATTKKPHVQSTEKSNFNPHESQASTNTALSPHPPHLPHVSPTSTNPPEVARDSLVGQTENSARRTTTKSPHTVSVITKLPEIHKFGYDLAEERQDRVPGRLFSGLPHFLRGAVLSERADLDSRNIVISSGYGNVAYQHEDIAFLHGGRER